RNDRRPYYNDKSDVYLVNQYYKKEYDNKEYTSEEYCDKEKYEVYLNTRSGLYSRNAVSKNKRKLIKILKLPRTTIVKDLVMKEPILKL
ncbi:4966_t:CDS:1, partial [Funneliformis caledonium]